MKREWDHEFALAAQVFNLAPEAAEDPERVAREKREAEQRAKDAAEFAKRCQRQFEQCPGFIGADAPNGPGLPGRVVVEPAKAPEAMAWLKRRYRVSENCELSGENICLDVIARAAAKPGKARTIRADFAKPVQFEFNLEQ